MKHRLSTWENAAIVGLLLIALVYGVFVECRATLTESHNTDLGVYLAAAQAVRENADICTATYNHNHYMYPPFLAILLAHVVPAPAAPGSPASTAFAVVVYLWYVSSLLALAVAINVLAKKLSRTGPENTTLPQSSRDPIWTLRLLPIVLCLHCLGRELQLGQIDIFLLALVAMTIAAAAEGRSGQAGLWLAAAICLKVVPLVLLLYPLWRRDWRWLLSCLGGLVAGLIILPMLILGYEKTVKYSQDYVKVLVMPAMAGKVTDHSRDDEMLNQNAVHNYSILGVIHNLENISTIRRDRPKTATPFNRELAQTLGLLLIFTTLAASGFRRHISPLASVLCLTMLTAATVISMPVCQSYYFVLLIPLYMAIIAADLRQSGSSFPKPATMAACVAYPIAQALSSFSPLLRDSGLVLATLLILWFVALRALRHTMRTQAC